MVGRCVLFPIPLKQDMSKSPRLAKRVLLIGWDAADWKLIDKYIAEGAMPYTKQFLERGSRGNLATLQPVLSPMLWNSIGTGKRPYKHGIHGFTEPMPDGRGVRPSSSTTRKCKALWNILTQEGMTANVVSWFCGHPAEPINGICVSDLFQKVKIGDDLESTELPPLADGCVHPESLREEIGELRIHPGELTEEEILFFIPKAAKIDQRTDPRLQMFAKLFAEMVSVHNAATFAIEQNDWDFMGVYYDSIDHFGHGFMEYHPPRMDHIGEEEFEIYQEIIAGCYKFHDLMLGRLMHLAGDDTTIILCSDHGYHSDHLRPKETPNVPAGPAIWHRDFGVVAMAGPGIKRGEQIYGANLLDITPTVLSLLGLPTAKDMDGKSLVQVIDGGQWWAPLDQIASWEGVEGEAGMHSGDEREDPYAAREALRQLVELGYIEEPDQDEEKAAKYAATEARFNVARAYADGGLLEEAVTHLEGLYQESPDQPRFGIALARVYMAQNRYDEVRPLAEELLAMIAQTNVERAERVEAAVRIIDDTPEEIIAKAKQKWGEKHQQLAKLEQAQAEEEQRDPVAIELGESPINDEFLKHRKLALQKTSEAIRGYDVRSEPTVNLLLGRLEALDGNYDKAVEFLIRAEETEPRLPGLHLQLGQTYLRLHRAEEAERAFERALDIDGDNALAHEGMATALSLLQRYDEAVDHGLTAVGLMHEMPRAHLRLGATLARLGLYEQSVLAFQTCLKLAPNTPAAHRYLAMIYRSKLGHRDLASTHSFKLKMLQDQNRTDRNPAAKPENSPSSHPKLVVNTVAISSEPGLSADPSEVITIVTGLPRSGTSMMMQMLVAGGMTPLTDGKREADTSNPNGYFEYDKATQLGSNSDWIGEGKGKVVKIVVQLLPHLPSKLNGDPVNYRIIFMERNLEEVIASQRTMLDHHGRKGGELEQARLAEIFGEQLQKIGRTIEDRGIPCLTVRYSDAILDSQSVADRVSLFFDESLDAQGMAAVVDPKLYREKS